MLVYITKTDPRIAEVLSKLPMGYIDFLWIRSIERIKKKTRKTKKKKKNNLQTVSGSKNISIVIF